MVIKNPLLGALTFGLFLCLSGAPSNRSRRGTTAGCTSDHFWNEDMSKCLSCSICKVQSKTPGCDMCPRDCQDGMFWNFDTQQCISCKVCSSQPKTPQCHTCKAEGTPSPPGPVQVTQTPAWIWVLIAMVIVAVPLAALLAWIKSKEFHTSDVAKPVQEIGAEDEPELRNLTSD